MVYKRQQQGIQQIAHYMRRLIFNTRSKVLDKQSLVFYYIHDSFFQTQEPLYQQNKTEQLKDHGYSKIFRLRNNTDFDELRD